METKVTRPAVLVDWDTFKITRNTIKAVNEWKNKATIVLLVADPEDNDYQYEYPELFDIVIRNHGMTTNMAFKVQALCVVQDSSALVPVIAVDRSSKVLSMFEDGGVLITYHG